MGPCAAAHMLRLVGVPAVNSRTGEKPGCGGKHEHEHDEVDDGTCSTRFRYFDVSDFKGERVAVISCGQSRSNMPHSSANKGADIRISRNHRCTAAGISWLLRQLLFVYLCEVICSKTSSAW